MCQVGRRLLGVKVMRAGREWSGGGEKWKMMRNREV